VHGRCIPWDPIPQHAATVDALEIIRFEEVRLLRRNYATLTLGSFWRYDRQSDRVEVWRVQFENVAAYRLTDSGFWFDRLPIEDGDRERGLWEITESSWLSEVIPSNYPGPWHHFVVVSVGSCEGQMYEIAARSWRVEELEPLSAAMLLPDK
jgi:hypothetical protein